MLDLLARRKRTIREALTPYHVDESGHSQCPRCGVVALVYHRTKSGAFVCTLCRDKEGR